MSFFLRKKKPKCVGCGGKLPKHPAIVKMGCDDGDVEVKICDACLLILQPLVRDE